MEAEIFRTPCNNCGKIIECEVADDSYPNPGGLIENDDFHLWGPYAMCGNCNQELDESYRKYMKEHG